MSEVCEVPAPQSLFIDDYLRHRKHTENVLHLCLTEVNNTGIAIEPQFVIHENENVLDCCKNMCAKFAHACNLELNNKWIFIHLHLEVFFSSQIITYFIVDKI